MISTLYQDFGSHIGLILDLGIFPAQIKSAVCPSATVMNLATGIPKPQNEVKRKNIVFKVYFAINNLGPKLNL